MIKFKDVTTKSFKSVSFKIEKGKRYKIITESDDERREFFDTLLAFTKPLYGTVELMGKDLLTATKNETSDVLRKIGVVWKYGGLISSLSILDSVLLPLKYHKVEQKLKLTDEGTINNMFKQLGSNISDNPGYLKEMCGNLHIHDKRLIGTVRAMISEPDLIIYESLFEGYRQSIVNNLIDIVENFHKQKEERTSIFLFSKSEEESGKHATVDFVIRQNGKHFDINTQ